MIVSPAQLAEIYSVDPRTVTNWINSTPPCPSWIEGRSRKFDTSKVAEWREAQAVAKALANVSREAPGDLEEAELRKAVADALIAEIKAAREEGSVIPIDVHQDVVGELGDRAMAVVQNIPSTYSLDLERLGITPHDARLVLEQVQDDLVRALRGVADDFWDDVENANPLKD